MTSRASMIAGLALCILSAPAFAQESPSGTGGAAATAPKRSPELDRLRPILVGSLKCTGKAFASSFGPEHLIRVSVVTTPELDDFWYISRGEAEKTADDPTPGKFHTAFGYDAAKKKFLAIGIDNLGGHWMETSDGPAGDKIVYTGTFTMNGNDTNIRDTISATHHVGEVQVGSDWQKIDEETCEAAP